MSDVVEHVLSDAIQMSGLRKAVKHFRQQYSWLYVLQNMHA